VVSAGVKVVDAVSSKPTTETSSGTRSPDTHRRLVIEAIVAVTAG
jgi:hypothetical protein